MTYVKQRNVQNGSVFPYWKLYDDNKPIKTFASWRDILEKILEYGTLPTVLIYEKLDRSNQNDDQFDTLTSTELKVLEYKAQEL